MSFWQKNTIHERNAKLDVTLQEVILVNMSLYEAYFDAQVGRGKNSLDNVETLYTQEANQRGCGIGIFLGGALRRVLPMIKAGSREVGKEAVRTGFNIMKDVTHGKVRFRNSLKNRIKESGKNLKRKAEQNCWTKKDIKT